jgi:hypothetical protein
MEEDPMRARLLVALTVSILVAGCATAASPAAGPGASPPALSDPTATGKELVTRFFDLLHAQDVAGLRDFLSPGFQIERADGTGTTRDDYLTKLPTVNTYQLSELSGTQAGSVLVVRYLATVEGLVNGKPYTPGPAPRLSVFVWNGSAWQLAAHANFNPLTG